MISIIIATYNRAQYLKASIESVLSQTYKNIELVVIDDGSSDDTEGLVRSINDERIKYFKSPKNGGATNARNKGIEYAKGDFIMIWDSDDVLYPHALDTVVGSFDRYPGAVVVSAPARTVFLKKAKEVFYKQVPEGFLDQELVIARELPPANEKIRVVRSSVMKQIRYESRNIDFLVNVAIAEKGEWYHLNQFLGDVIQYDDTVSLTKKRKIPSITLSKQRAPYLAAYLEKHYEIILRRAPSRYKDFSYSASLGLLLRGENKRARSILKKNIEQSIKNAVLSILAFLPLTSVLLKLLYKIKGFYLRSIRVF